MKRGNCVTSACMKGGGRQHIIHLFCLIPVMLHSWEEHLKRQEVKAWVISQHHLVQMVSTCLLYEKGGGRKKNLFFSSLYHFLSHAGVLCLFFDLLY